uniref:Uncharacterized protein n=1 Tax=Arundo donax TaxID=35708 RepID=A0A0A8ZQT3_ARUDO
MRYEYFICTYLIPKTFSMFYAMQATVTSCAFDTPI